MLSLKTVLRGGQLVVLALAALFLAWTASEIIEMVVRPAPRVRVVGPASEVPPEPEKPLVHYASISGNGVFAPPKVREVPQAAPPAQIPPLNAKLLGTAPGFGLESHAIIEDQTTRKQELYRLGDDVQGRTLQAVEWDHVVLVHDGHQEILEVTRADSSSAPVAVARPAAAAPPENGIQKLDETSYAIAREEVDRSMENLNELFTQIRAVPHLEGGEAAGFRLFAIRRGSIFEKLGLRNGDILAGVNGQALSDPVQAMSLLQQLKGTSDVALDIRRNRQDTTLNYQIR